MDDDSVNFGSDTAGATPGSNSILAQPPLQGEDTPQESSGQGEGMNVRLHTKYTTNHTYR